MSMSDKNRMFVAQSNDNEYLYQDHSGNLGRMLYRYYSQKDAQNAIEMAGRTNQCHVVELIESAVKIAVSEDEAEMLKDAKDTTAWRPAAVIANYAYNAAKDSDQEALLEDRLMRAYVNGYTVEKEKRYLVRVPHANRHYYYQKCDSGEVIPVWDMETEPPTQFTDAEIEHYGLQCCECVEVTNHEQ